MNKKRVISALLLAAMLISPASVISCGGSDPSGKETDPPSGGSESSSEETSDEGYQYYKDLGGKEFNILNIEKDLWHSTCYLCPEEVAGDTLSDVVHKRNLFVEQNLNCVINETNIANGEVPSTLQTMVASNETTYDAAYLFMSDVSAGIANGNYIDLSKISTMNLDESWWDSVLMDATSIGGKNYFGSSSAHLMGWDLLWCLYFNDKMMDSLGLERPYELVRTGKWTLDEFQKYCFAAANLNGDDKFSVKREGNSVGGCVSFGNSISKFIFSCDALYVAKDKDDMPVVDCGNRFVEVCGKLASFFGEDGLFLNASPDDFRQIFEAGRALFLGAEIKASQEMRELDWNFGLVPFPKYDEKQDIYMTTSAHQAAVLVIPVTNPDPETTGLFFDAMSYESDRMVLPSYFGNVVEQKGLRDEESIEMLQLIKKGRSYDIGVAYQWSNSIEEAVGTKLLSGSGDVVSSIDKNTPKVEAAIQKTLDAIN